MSLFVSKLINYLLLINNMGDIGENNNGNKKPMSNDEEENDDEIKELDFQQEILIRVENLIEKPTETDNTDNENWIDDLIDEKLNKIIFEPGTSSPRTQNFNLTREDGDSKLNIIFEPSEPSTSKSYGVNSNLNSNSNLNRVDQITNSITVYNSENARCTILADGKSQSENVVDIMNNAQNSVVLVFTHLLNQLSVTSLNEDLNVPTTSTGIIKPPDYATIIRNPYKVVLGQSQNFLTDSNQTCFRIPSPPIFGAPPSYSTVLKLEPQEPPRNTRAGQRSIRLQPSPPFIAPPPPPSYAETQGQFSTRDVLSHFDEYVWGPDSILIFCPRCATIVQTVTRYHQSNLTHFSALALCLCGCWPCCLLPYCMKSCKNTYHHCPHCQSFLGMYTPW